jgi:DnaJ-class molecular chaperone
MPSRLDQLDYYTLLQVDDNAESSEIKRAFRRFAQKYHPDQFIDASEKKRLSASEIYRRGSEAYQVLTQAEERSAYDAALEQGKIRLSPEERDRARAPEVEEVQLTDEDHISSPQAKALFRKAQQLESLGKIRDAWKTMDAANREEPGNDIIEPHLLRLAGRLRAGF